MLSNENAKLYLVRFRFIRIMRSYLNLSSQVYLEINYFTTVMLYVLKIEEIRIRI